MNLMLCVCKLYFQNLELSKIKSLRQISAKRGTDSSFVVEANIIALLPKSSRSQLVKMMNRGRVIRGRVKYRVAYRVDYLVDYQILASF